MGCLAVASTASATVPATYLSIFAGTGIAGAPTPGPALSSALHHPRGMAVDPTTGNLYIADYGNSDVERVTPQGTLSIVAGHNTYGAPTPGPAASSAMGNPTGVAVSSSGDVYIADPYNNVVERVTPQGTLSIAAGTGTAGPPTHGPATQSDLREPYGVAVDAATGDLYIADYGNDVVERVTPQGTLSVVAGTGTAGAPTPGPATGSATGSALGSVSAVAVNAGGDVYVADPFYNVVERVTPQGTLSVVAGTGASGAPTPGPATRSALHLPHGVAVDPTTGNLYIADYGNSDVEQVTPQGILSIVAGTGYPGAPTPGLAASSALDAPLGVGVDPGGRELYIADTSNNRIEQIGPMPAPVNLTAPSISGKAQQGRTLTAVNGTWSNGPARYQHQWQDCNRSGGGCRNIAGATGSTYTPTRSDVGHRIVVVVIATNAGGSQAGSSAATATVSAAACPAPSGRLTGVRLGPIALGMTRARARRAMPRHTVTHHGLVDRFCLSGGRAILAGYPSARLRRTMGAHRSTRMRGRVVLLLTTGRHYKLDHIRAGVRVARVHRRLAHARRLRIGVTTWYLRHGRRATGVVEVRGGIVKKVGIAKGPVVATSTGRRRLLRGL